MLSTNKKLFSEDNIYDFSGNINIDYINQIINFDTNTNNILIDNLNNIDMLFENSNLCILLKTSIISNTKYVINKNHVYIDKMPSFHIINKYFDKYYMHEKIYNIHVNNNFINLHGYYLNLISSINENYFHFIFETLPYLYSFLKNNYILYNETYDFNILINKDFNIIKTLFNLNIIYSKQNENYNIEKLIIPKNIDINYYLCWNKYNIFKNEDIMSYNYDILLELREFIFNKLNIKPICQNNVYLKRNNNFRIFINNNYFDKIINDFNFDVIFPEFLSFQEQVAYFSQVNTLICQGGAGMTNILFMPEYSNVIIIVSGSEFVNHEFFNKLLLKLKINFHIIKTTPIYLYDNIYENNTEYMKRIGLEKHPYNSNFYFNKLNFINFIELVKKYTNKINYNFNYSILINDNILSEYNFYIKNYINNNITYNVDYDKIYKNSYIFMLKKDINNIIKENNTNKKNVNFDNIVKTANTSKKNVKTSNTSKKNVKTANTSKKNVKTSNTSKKNVKISNTSKKNVKISNTSKKNVKISNTSKKNVKLDNIVKTSNTSKKNVKLDNTIKENNINLIKYYNNIYFVQNNTFLFDKNSINDNLLINSNFLINDNNLSIIKCSKNVLLNSIKINKNTNYNYNHTEIDFTNNNLKPSIDILENYIEINSNKINNDNSLIIENAVFFYSLSNNHYYIAHLFNDFMQHINMYYHYLSINNNCSIILEIIPFSNYSFDKIDVNNFNIDNLVNINNINKLIKFTRDIGLNNNILIISPIAKYQNFDNDSLFIKNIYYTSFIEYDNIKWIPLLSCFCKNNYNNYLCDTLNNIINKKYNSEENIHFEYHKKKFFILEKPSKIILKNNINITENNILKICQEYCDNNNLFLIIWDSNLMNRETIFEQYNIVNNCEIIIFSSNFFNMFNFSMNNGKTLILNNKIGYDGYHKILYDLSFYKYNYIFKNKNINKIVLHYYDYNNLYDIINNFLYKVT